MGFRITSSRQFCTALTWIIAESTISFYYGLNRCQLNSSFKLYLLIKSQFSILPDHQDCTSLPLPAFLIINSFAHAHFQQNSSSKEIRKRKQKRQLNTTPTQIICPNTFCQFLIIFFTFVIMLRNLLLSKTKFFLVLL